MSLGGHDKTRPAESAHPAAAGQPRCLPPYFAVSYICKLFLPPGEAGAAAAPPGLGGCWGHCAVGCGTSARALLGWTIVHRKRKRGVVKTVLLTPSLAREYAPSNDRVLNRHLPGARHETRPPGCVISMSPVVTPPPSRDFMWLIDTRGITDHPD